ncbi:MAG TPA: ABC transporter permease subunit [Thermoanaerobaculia bacterium]|jgi:ABC-type transport system involved in multi-copper enzyme maturation permease subunit|nr:ABC transporter permease subunit [Thermoanaerobaculia bacterium]
MKAFAANLEDVFREAAARWTLVAYFTLSSLFILIFACAVNLDIVNGALAGAKIFGQSVQMGGEKVDLDKLVLGFESGFAGFLYLVGTFLAVFATAHLVPRMQERGTVDLYLSRPVSRPALLLSRYSAGLLLSASNLVYLLGAIWLIVALKTHVFSGRFFLAGGVILFGIAALLAFAFLVGVVTSSTAVSIMATYALFFFSAMLAVHDKIAATLSSEWGARTIHGLYWALPKTADLGKAAVALVAGDEIPHLSKSLALAPFLSTGAFTLVALSLAVILFRRKDF